MVVGNEPRIFEHMINSLMVHPSFSLIGLEDLEEFLANRNKKMCCFLGDSYVNRVAVSVKGHESN